MTASPPTRSARRNRAHLGRFKNGRELWKLTVEEGYLRLHLHRTRRKQDIRVPVSQIVRTLLPQPELFLEEA